MNGNYARIVLVVSAYLAEIQDIINYTIGHTCNNEKYPISHFFF